jgi:hypothetical protein
MSSRAAAAGSPDRLAAPPSAAPAHLRAATHGVEAHRSRPRRFFLLLGVPPFYFCSFAAHSRVFRAAPMMFRYETSYDESKHVSASIASVKHK